MTKFLTGKITALAALLAGTSVLSGCETSAGKPEICKTDAGVVNQRCVEPKPKPHQQTKKHVAAKETGRSNY
ncbi:hypothetical protein [Shinella sp.]|uniref:hypothetical protein n=1 Tax=Shinella sp. TaxID=1870904 RepID=UPI0028ACFA96|nr:hypothetical protein [Shinella sp.]